MKKKPLSHKTIKELETEFPHLTDWKYKMKMFDSGVIEMSKEAYDKVFENFDYGTKNSKQWRKERPLATGVLAYFPNALLEVAHTSFVGNEQHNKGEPLHWAREKSTDQLDAALRHITDHLKGEHIDDDGCYHLSKGIWRLCAELEILLEKK